VLDGDDTSEDGVVCRVVSVVCCVVCVDVDGAKTVLAAGDRAPDVSLLESEPSLKRTRTATKTPSVPAMSDHQVGSSGTDLLLFADCAKSSNLDITT
jgi:hypothetical protein